MGFASEMGGGYNGRVTVFVVLSCMVAASGGLLFGYDLGISGGVSTMEGFLEKFFPEVYTQMKEDTKISNYCRFNSELLTTFTSSLYIAGLVASLFASPITRAFGRRASMLIGGAMFLAGAALGGAATNVYMVIFGRVLLGAGIGFTNQSIPLYLSEMAPPQHRGAMNNGFEVCVSIGILVANFINYGINQTHIRWGWRISLALASVPASFLTVGTFFLPETPNNIIQRNGDLHKAEQLLQKIRGTTDVKKELDDLISAGIIAKGIRHPFRKIIQQKYRPQLVMAILIPFFQQVTGINVINFYAPIMFRTIGLKESASLMAAICTRLVALSCNILAMVLADRWGRRTLFITGGIQMFLSQIIVGGILAAEFKDHGEMIRGIAYLVLAIICFFVAGFSWSWGPLGWLVPSEIFPLEIRSAGQSIVVAVNFLATFLVAHSFLPMLCHLKSGTFFFFGGWVAAMTFFIYMFLPETRNVPVEQMDQVWKKHWFWKKMVWDGKEESKVDPTSTADSHL
uniref:Hexose carrier protein HEX6 n=1 Tax=Elaeis guineensis var. tenera TaxID=51953 RepID=A0A6J0PI41_ELAGV|nr:hexose carrier protein HEX6 [Elaeis guineensis]